MEQAQSMWYSYDSDDSDDSDVLAMFTDGLYEEHMATSMDGAFQGLAGGPVEEILRRVAHKTAELQRGVRLLFSKNPSQRVLAPELAPELAAALGVLSSYIGTFAARSEIDLMATRRHRRAARAAVLEWVLSYAASYVSDDDACSHWSTKDWETKIRAALVLSAATATATAT